MWARYGDTSAFHPLPMNVLEHPELDDRLLNEVFGFFTRCSTQAAAHLTDYVITRGTAVAIAGPTRVTDLIAVCVFAGLMTERDHHGVTVYKLVDDEPDFLHLRLKKDIDWERQRKADANRPSLIVPVRIRDGDACRWCGKVVDWSDRKSGRAGTYDHLNPGEPASIDTYVVCCKTCNSSRQDGVLPAGVDGLLEAPDEPLFGESTITWLTANRWRQKNGLPVPTQTDPSDIAKYLVRVPGSQPDASTDPHGDPHPAGHPSPDTTAATGATTPGTTTASEMLAATGATPMPGTAADGATQRTQQTPRTAATGATSGPAATGADQPEQAATGAAPGRDEPISQISARYQVERTDQCGTASVVSGRAGSGRDGTGSESLTPPSHERSSRRRGRRGSRSRRKGTP